MSKLQLEAKESPISLILSEGIWVTTIALMPIQGVFATEWWTSRVDSEGGIQMFASLQMPINESHFSKSKQIAKNLHSTYMSLLETQNEAKCDRFILLPNKEIRGHIARAHILTHIENEFSFHLDLSQSMQTYLQSEFCKSIGVSSPAFLLSEIHQTSPKTINQRIFEAKRKLKVTDSKTRTHKQQGRNAKTQK